MSSDAAPHFHVTIVPIRARERQRSDKIVRRYITRGLERQRRRPGHALQIVRGYASREASADAAREVLYYTYHDGGTGLSADELYDAVDKGRRRKDGQYKRHAGRRPRLGLFVTLSVPHGLGLAASCACVDRFLNDLNATYGIAGEAVIHRKGDVPDHVHCVVTDVRVGPQGVGGKVRELNGISQKLLGQGIEDDGRILAPAAEYIRARWAELLTEAGGRKIDHRSYARQGRDLQPLTVFSKAEIDRQRRLGDEVWRDTRALEIAARETLKAEKAARAVVKFTDCIHRPDPQIREIVDEEHLVEVRKLVEAYGRQIDAIAATRRRDVTAARWTDATDRVFAIERRTPGVAHSRSHPASRPRQHLGPTSESLFRRRAKASELHTAIGLASGSAFILFAVLQGMLRRPDRTSLPHLYAGMMIHGAGRRRRTLGTALLQVAHAVSAFAKSTRAADAHQINLNASSISSVRTAEDPARGVGKQNLRTADQDADADRKTMPAESDKARKRAVDHLDMPTPTAPRSFEERPKTKPTLRQSQADANLAQSSAALPLSFKVLEEGDAFGDDGLERRASQGPAASKSRSSRRHSRLGDPSAPQAPTGATPSGPSPSKAATESVPATAVAKRGDGPEQASPVGAHRRELAGAGSPELSRGRSIVGDAPSKEDEIEASARRKLEDAPYIALLKRPVAADCPDIRRRHDSLRSLHEGDFVQRPFSLARARIEDRPPIPAMRQLEVDREEAKRERRRLAQQRRVALAVAVAWRMRRAWIESASVGLARLLDLTKDQFDRAVVVTSRKPLMKTAKPSELIAQGEQQLRDMQCHALLDAMEQIKSRYESRKKTKRRTTNGPSL